MSETDKKKKKDTFYCKTCPLNPQKLKQISEMAVHTHGDLATAKILFVGEAPGAEEERQGLPFVGKAGQEILKNTIKKFKIERKDIAFGNIVRCRPKDSGGKNRKPDIKEMRRCVKYLKDELDTARVDEKGESKPFDGLVVILGATALEGLLNRKSIRLARGYGYLVDGYKYLVTHHPARLLYHPEFKGEFEDDIRKAGVWLNKKFKLDYEMIDDTTKLCNFLLWVDEEIRQRGILELSFDTETTGLDPFDPKNKILGLSLATDTRAWFVPLEHPRSPFKGDSEKIMEYLSPIFINKRIRTTAQHAKFDIKFLWKKYNIVVQNLYFDTKVAHFLIVGKFFTHRLNGMAWKYTDLGGYDVDASTVLLKDIPLEEVAEYGAMDAYVTFKLRLIFEDMLNKMNPEIMNLLTDIICPAIQAVSEIEVDGLKLDMKRLNKFYKEQSERLVELEEMMHSYKEIQTYESKKKELINFRSHPQLRMVFDMFGLKPKKRTKKLGAVSTDEDALLEVKSQHPFIANLIEHRGLEKSFGTYIRPYKERHREEIIRGDYSFITTATGRLACEKPNLQNIPYRLRPVFRSKYGWFLSVDYSQLELRILAAYSFDETLIDIYRTGKDAHEMTRQILFGDKPKDELEAHDQRVVAKTLNFGIVYGITPIGVSISLTKALGRNVDQGESESYIRQFFNKYRGVQSYINNVKQTIHRDGFIDTYFGRRRYFDVKVEPNRLEKVYKEAMNYPIQSTASDVVLYGTGKAWDKMRDEGMISRMNAHVHDEVLFDIPKKELLSVIGLLKPAMENITFPWLNVPLKIDIQIGTNWGELKELEL